MKPSLEAFEQLTPYVWRIVGLNPGPMTLTGTNTFLIGQKRDRILIDTGEKVAGYKENLGKVLELTGSKITKVLITHWHLDHTLGIAQVRELCPEAKVYKRLIGLEADDKIQKEYDFIYNQLEDRQEINTEGVTIVAVKCPGHTDDHYG